MAWKTLLKSQQAEFLKRLKSGTENLIFCQLDGCFSELVIIAEPALQRLRDFSWQALERQKNTDSARTIFLENLAFKLGEEAVKRQLLDLLARDSHKDLISTHGKTNFNTRQWRYFITYIKAYQYLNQYIPATLFPIGCLRLAANPAIRIQVQVCCGAIETAQWLVQSEDVEKNLAIVCVLIREEVTETQPEYHVIVVGFSPTAWIDLQENQAILKPDDLLYCGGLRSLLETPQIAYPILSDQANHKKPPSDNFAGISIGPWKYPIAMDQLKDLEIVLQKILSSQTNIETQYNPSPPEALWNGASVPLQPLPPISDKRPEFNPLWNKVLNEIRPAGTQKLLRKESCVLFFDGECAQIGISSKALFMVNPQWSIKVEEAFEKILNRKIKVDIEVI